MTDALPNHRHLPSSGPGLGEDPWQRVAGRIEANDDGGLMWLLADLSEADRRAVAARLPGHLAERLGQGMQGPLWVARRVAVLRLAGAACLGGAAQVAAWLHRRELRHAVPTPETDADRILSLLRDRPEAWRRDLAVRLVRRLRPPARGDRWAWQALPGWELAARLVAETGVEPPENDAFVTAWAWRLAGRMWPTGRVAAVRDDPLLDLMVPRLFRAQGVADVLMWRDGPGWGTPLGGALAVLAAQGRLKRQDLVDGCAARLLAGGRARDLAPFLALWRELRPEPAELPVVDFVRLLPWAASAVAEFATAELRRADAAGLLDDELFAEAVQALAFRPERKHVTAALKWLAEAPPRRADGALTALAVILGHDAPALRDRAVRLAVGLAPHAAGPGRDAVRTAAAALPAEHRERLAVVFGELGPAEPEVPPAVPAPAAAVLPGLPPPITSLRELAAELATERWPDEPDQFERFLAALVELAHRDHAAVAEALRPWSRDFGPFDAHDVAHGRRPISGSAYGLLERLAQVIVSAGQDGGAAAGPDGERRDSPVIRPPLDAFLRRRALEVIGLLESGRTLPVLLATPTEPTGHLDPAVLVARLARLGDAEPPAADFCQALLRLPRRADPAVAVRAEGLASPAGRRLAAWLRRGGPPDPAVTCGLETWRRPHPRRRLEKVDRVELHARAEPPAGDLPEPIRDLCTLRPHPGPRRPAWHMAWWPAIMPSHPEVVAAHVLEGLAAGDDLPPATLVRLGHGDGPAADATASVLVLGMDHRRPQQRTAALDALRTLAARDRFPAADFGRALVRSVTADLVKLNRVAAVLAEAVLAGAHAHLWPGLAAALPALLPAVGERPRAGLGDLLAVAAQAAELAEARGEIPELAAVADRGGSSRLAQEARRLHRLLTR